MIIEQSIRIVVIIIIVLACILPIHKNELLKSPLDKRVANRIKGIACILVVIAHSSNQLDGGLVFALSSNIGFIAVGIFFFFSGYGLEYSLLNKNNYLKGFIKKRILSILIPFWFSNIIVFLFYISIGKKYSIKDAIEMLLGIKLFIGHNWYVQTIIIIYLLFFIISKIIKSRKIALIAITTVTTVIIILSQVIEIPFLPKYCLSGFTFIFGLWIAYDKRILSYIVNIKPIFQWFIVLITILLYIYLTIIRWHMFNNTIGVGVASVLVNIFVILIIVCISNLYLYGNRLIDIIGGCSFEIYLLHQLAINTVKNMHISKGLELGLIVIISIIIGYLLSRIDKFFINRYLKKI